MVALKELFERHGELTDDDIRSAARRAGLPESTVYGISTFYDDLNAKRGKRHVRVCTGTACFAATGGAHADAVREGLGLDLGERSNDGKTSLGEVYCLGFCHSSPAIEDGDCVVAGPDAVAAVLERRQQPAPEPHCKSLLDEPVLLRAGDYSGLRAALQREPKDLLDAVVAADIRGRGGAGFPAGTKWRLTANAPGGPKYVAANGDEGDPGSYIDKVLMEQNPELVIEGLALAGYAVGAEWGLILTRSEYPESKRALKSAVIQARRAGLLGEDILGSGFTFDVRVLEGAGSYVVGEETALMRCLHGLRGTVVARPPFPAERGIYNKPTLVQNIETLTNVPFVAARGADAYRALGPSDASTGSKLVCFNERFARPGVYEVPFGMTVAELCHDVAGGPRDGHTLKAVQIGGPLGGILPASLFETRFDFGALAEHGCMLGHGSIVGFDETTDVRALARHLIEFGVAESCGMCFPCRIGMTRANEMVQQDRELDRLLLEPLLQTMELGSLCAHGGGLPKAIRSLMNHFPDELRVST